MLKAEIQAFFILDTCKCVSEYDDPKDAILYFYPPQVPESYQCTLCCQLMGVVQFYNSFFSFPKMLSLENGKFAVMKCEWQYLLCLGGLSDTPDYLLSKCLDFMYGLFTFYHKSISAVLSEPDFANKVREIWNSCIAATFPEDRSPPYFVVLPWLQTTETSLYLSASHIVQSCQKYPLFLAGCIFHKGELLFTQLEPDLTQFLCCFNHLRSVAKIVCFPKDVLFLNIYIIRRAVHALMDKHWPTSNRNARGPNVTVGRSTSASEDYETPSTNLGSEVSSTETLDSTNYLSSLDDVEFSGSLRADFSDSFESSLTLIHKVTHDSLETLNARTSPFKPRRKKKSQSPVGVHNHSSSHTTCNNLSKQKRLPEKLKGNVDGSCDSSFFESPSLVRADYELAKEYAGIPMNPQSQEMYMNICNNAKIPEKTDSLDINSIFTEKDVLLIKPLLHRRKPSPLNSDQPSKFSRMPALEWSEVESRHKDVLLIEPLVHIPKGLPLNSEELPKYSEVPASERSEVKLHLDSQNFENTSLDGSLSRTVRESESRDEDDGAVMSKLDLFVFRHCDTDLCLLMNDGAGDCPSVIGEIHKTTEKCLKNLNESLVLAARPVRERPSKSSRSFLVDNCWRTQSGDPGPDDQGLSWAALKENFHRDPTLKCATVSSLKGTAYAHSSVTHQVFNSVAGSYTPGIPDAQDVLAQISTLPKQSSNKLGYYLLR